jgi:hypothetical protein
LEARREERNIDEEGGRKVGSIPEGTVEPKCEVHAASGRICV